MRRPRLALFLSCIGSLVAGCSDDRAVVGPTEPRAHVVGAITPCDGTLAALIESEIDALFAGSVRSAFRKKFGEIKRDCPKRSAAVVKVVSYTKDYLASFFKVPSHVRDPDGSGPITRESASADHFGHLFAFVGQPMKTPLHPKAFTSEGAIKVCGGSGDCELTTGTELAGMKVHAGAVSRDFLFSIFPLPDAKCQRENLDFIPICFDFSVNPVTTFISPWVTVVICHASGLSNEMDAFVESRVRVAHPDPKNPATAIKINPEPLDRDGARFVGDFHCDNAPPLSSLGLGNANLAVRAWNQLGRVASRAFDLFGPPSLYAINTKGGKTSSFSPFGLVNPLIFRATFTNDVVGQPPGTKADSGRGTWFDSSTSPGSILVQSSIGDLTNKPVVLSQGGGACTQCGGLELRGTVYGSSPDRPRPTTGVYSVSWRSLQAKPTLKEAPFVLRADGPDGPIIATLAYAAQGSSKVLRYNGTNVGVPWVQNVSQFFEITVDLNNKTTTLNINGGTPEVVNAPFLDRNPLATNLAQIAAEFSGIDTGIVGWDNIAIVRNEDPLPH